MSCIDCEYYYESRSGYEYGNYLEEVGCEKNKKLGNLKSFPFQKLQKCFRLNFWKSKYADRISGDPDNDIIQFDKYWKDKCPQKSDKPTPDTEER